MKEGKTVVPGSELCVIEEFMSGEGTYEDNGIVRAAVLGYVQYDMVNRVVKVKKVHGGPFVPRQGLIVHGIVVQVSDEVAIVKIMYDHALRRIKHTYTGVLHISQVSSKYVQSMHDAVKVGDVIKAKVLNNSIPYLLSIRDIKLGVVISHCSKCGGRLIKIGEELLKCVECGNVERRKIAYDYIITK
ncbi:MAG TPA: S1 RNA-binding domain-containing protein [Acidilobales archaeon]|nr:S1 RNA-binding domain-containing protein [Acidilobales archaeon]